MKEGQSCKAASRKYGVAKNTVSHWSKKFEENVSKERKRLQTVTYEEVDSAMCKWLKNARQQYSNQFYDESPMQNCWDLMTSKLPTDGWDDGQNNVSFKTFSGKYTFTTPLKILALNCL